MIPINLKKCKTCASRAVAQNNTPACAKFKIPVNLEKDYCSWHTISASSCLFCGATEDLFIENINNKNYSFCADHYKAFHSCQGCANSIHCGFKEDNSEPHVIPIIKVQGNMRIQSQQKNPNLVERHCASCQCSYLEDNSPICIRETECAQCANWSARIDLLQ